MLTGSALHRSYLKRRRKGNCLNIITTVELLLVGLMTTQQRSQYTCILLLVELQLEVMYANLFTSLWFIIIFRRYEFLIPLHDMPILGFSSSAANKDMMSKILTNEDAIF